MRTRTFVVVVAAAVLASLSLAAIATKARSGLLVLTHQLFWGTTEEALVAEVRKGYAGKVVSGRDLDVF